MRSSSPGSTQGRTTSPLFVAVAAVWRCSLCEDPRKALLLVYKPHLFPDIIRNDRRLARRGREVRVSQSLPRDRRRLDVQLDPSPGNKLRCILRDSIRSYSAAGLVRDLSALDLKEGFRGRIWTMKMTTSTWVGHFLTTQRFRTVMLPWTIRHASARCHSSYQWPRRFLKLWLIQSAPRYLPQISS